MNPSNPFGSPQGGAFQGTVGSVKNGLFQTSGPQSSRGQSFGGFQPPAFGQPQVASQTPPMFVQQSSTILTAAHSGSIFGQQPRGTQTGSQSGSIFGQQTGTQQFVSQSSSIFGNQPGTIKPASHSGSVFGQSSCTIQSAGQGSSFFVQPSSQPAFQSSFMFGQTTGIVQPVSQSGSIFGQSSGTNQPASQSGSIFGQSSGTNKPGSQSGSIFGQSSGTNQPGSQSGSIFGQSSGTNQPASQSGSIFGQSSETNKPGSQSGSIFGQSSGTNQHASQSGSIFGQSSGTNQPASQSGSIFGQSSGTNQPGSQSGSIFGQSSGTNQPSSQGGSVFGQSSGTSQPSSQGGSIFGQSSGTSQPSSQGGSIFGQSSGTSQPASQSGSIFGQPSVKPQPIISQPTVFGQPPMRFISSATLNKTSAFGQPSSFGQTPVLRKPPPSYVSSQSVSSSKAILVQPQASSFGQPSSADILDTNQNRTQSRGFGTSEFSFKPANEALFKPISSAGSELPITQSLSTSSSSFESHTSSITKSLPSVAGQESGLLGFSFAPPAVASSVPSQGNPPTCADGKTATNAPQFEFAKPAAVSSTTEPTTPSSFSFKTQPTFFPKAETSVDNDNRLTPQAETNVFERLNKGAKRKTDAGSILEKPPAKEVAAFKADSPRHPSKRQHNRPHGRIGGLFSQALSGIRKEQSVPVRRDPAKETQKLAVAVEDQDEAHYDGFSVVPRAVQTLTRDNLEKAPDSVLTSSQADEARTPPGRGARRDSLDSLSGVSPSDLTTIMCRNIPLPLNKKHVIESHFAQFGGLGKVFCRPNKNLAIVHFEDHAAAAKAKKKGKILRGHELLILWQKKKQSPADKGSRAAARNQTTEGESSQVEEPKSVCSPLKRPAPMPPTLSSSLTFPRSSPAKRPSPAKMLQFDAESQRENVPESLLSDRSVPSSLIPLIGQVAETAEDKYRLLEQRDKILRQGRPKRTDLDLSKVFVGTCPDMCPEKERYMRETRNQLSVFEVIPNTEMVDHVAAIKEYSRSSADQEEPLPHELRPLPVLSMTMDYLVTQILDQGQDTYRDWYDFVWNRTRGIRKDITQQRLCCPDTVSLIEKCTRFHVHCAHHLCEEHMSSFDAKINNENMTKCLQSLKEMYEDLAMQGTFCRREAEFRQYNVLLKLNDGDILREVQQFRDEVRNSLEVKFAVQAFTAVSSNNFVRFFKLVKGASYLASCLLHRYFNQVRAKALKTINMAHTVGPRSTPFPVDDIARMLMFRDGAEAADFIQQYGLNVNEGMVELSRIAFQEPELPLSQKKSEVILAKRMTLIGQVVNGGPLPSPPQHIPVCSFDLQNKFRGSGPLAEPSIGISKANSSSAPCSSGLQLHAAEFPPAPGQPPPATEETGEPHHPELFPPISQPEPVKTPSPPPAPEPAYSEEDIMAELDAVIDEVVGAEVKEVADGGANYISTALLESCVQAEVLLAEVLGQMMQEISLMEVNLERERVAEENRKLEEARRRQEREAFLAQFSCSLCTEVLHEVVEESVKEAAASEIQAAEREKAERLSKLSEQICCSLMEETLSSDVSLLVEEVLDVELERIHKYISRWRDVVSVRRQLKRQMRGFPAAPCCVDPHHKLKAFTPSAPERPSVEDLARGLVNLGNAGMFSVSSTRQLKTRRETIHQMTVQHFYQQLLEETVWAPLDLPALVMENFLDLTDRIFWKTLLLLPSDEEGVASLADRVLSDWLEVKLGGETDSLDLLDGCLKTLRLTKTLQESSRGTHEVLVTVKASRGPLSELGLSVAEERSELQGTAAIVLLLPAPPVLEPRQEDRDVPLLSALLQLKQLQQVSSWHRPLPLVLLVPGRPGAADTQKYEEVLMLQTLMQEELISEYTFFFIPESMGDLQGSKQLTRAVQWLLSHSPPPLQLACRTLVQLVEATLSQEFVSRVFAHRQERALARLPSQDAAPVVRLYNAVLDHVADKVSSLDLCRLSWPPAEFSQLESRDFVPHLGWNAEQHLSWLRAVILSLKLPEWEELPAADSWSELCSALSRYADKIPLSRRCWPLLMSRLENLLERVRFRNQQFRVTEEALSASVAFAQIPWDDVVEICIDHKLKDWQLPGPPPSQDAVTEDGEIRVYFLEGSLEGFQPPEDWTQTVEQSHREKQHNLEELNPAACSPPPSLTLRQNLFHSPEGPAEGSTSTLNPTYAPTVGGLLAHKVLQSFEEEKAESKRSLEQLQRWLDGDPVEQLSSPLLIPSTLLSSLAIRTVVASDKTQAAAVQPEAAESWTWKKTTPPSLEWRMKSLQRQILASQEEELACKLHLSSLLSIVED